MNKIDFKDIPKTAKTSVDFTPNQENIWKLITKALDAEIESIHVFRAFLDRNLVHAVELLLQLKGKVICTGVGKSGDIAKKISSTLSSTGTPALFLHPTDALHGDAGIIQKDDIVLAIGKSGESEELNSLLPTIRKLGSQLIAITANPQSTLAKAANVVIHTPIIKEACPLALAPTSSTTIALMVGDAIAMSLMELKNFNAENFALYHPAGRLGKRLSLQVDDVMRKGELLPMVSPDDIFADILEEISKKMMGATAVVSPERKLIGIITDYDIRKILQKGFHPNLTAKEIMNPNPIFFQAGANAYDVLVQMETRSRPISVAPVVDQDRFLLGMILLHDLLQKGL